MTPINMRAISWAIVSTHTLALKTSKDEALTVRVSQRDQKPGTSAFGADAVI
jgi:hypothetical protein